MISWGTIQLIATIAVPIFLPRAISFVQKLQSHHGRLRPVDTRTQWALGLIGASAILFLARALRPKENVMVMTESRMLTPVDVIATRLSRIRQLTEQDERISSRLGSMDGKILFTLFGPDPLGNCVWCDTSDFRSFLLYALPSIALPHLVHIALLGAATSTAMSSEAAVWRPHATIAAIILALAEIAFTANSPAHTNALAKDAKQITWWFNEIPMYRAFAIAIVDVGIALFVWMGATNRIDNGAHNHAAQIDGVLRKTKNALRGVNAGNLLRATITRDDDLSSREHDFYMHEEAALEESKKEPEVREARRLTLSRLRVEGLRDEAKAYTDALLLNS